MVGHLWPHPFHEGAPNSAADFMRIFGDPYQRRGDPPLSKLPRLVNLQWRQQSHGQLQLLELLGLSKIPEVFVLTESDVGSVLLYFSASTEVARPQGMKLSRPSTTISIPTSLTLPMKGRYQRFYVKIMESYLSLTQIRSSVDARQF